MNREDKFKQLVNLLESSQNEDDVIKYLTKMLKEFNIFFYKDIIFSNPYFKSLIPEIRDQVKVEVLLIKKTILDEIKNIESQIKITTLQDLEDLKDLKRDCLLLLNEVIEREKELESL